MVLEVGGSSPLIHPRSRSAGEEPGRIAEGLELDRVPARVEDEHRRLLADLASEADGLDPECTPALRLHELHRSQANRPEVAHGDVAVDVVGLGGTARRGEDGRDLVAEEVEVDPVLRAAALLQPSKVRRTRVDSRSLTGTRGGRRGRSPALVHRPVISIPSPGTAASSPHVDWRGHPCGSPSRRISRSARSSQEPSQREHDREHVRRDRSAW